MSSPTCAPSSIKRILFNTDVPYRLTDAERANLQAVCPGAEIVQAYGEARAGELELHDANILVTDLNVPRDLESCPKLEWVQLVSAGANQVTPLPIAQSAIPVTTASGLHGVPIAQYVTGALLMLVHQFPRLAAVQATRRWPEQRWDLRGALLRGATAGVIGYGSIGRECARQLQALGMRIAALDAGARRDDGYNAWPGTGDAEGKLPERWYRPEQLREMLPWCDVVVIAVPLTPKTHDLIAAAELALMKRGARIIIVSRGGIVNENALADALRAGQIGGAVVDCFVEEPLRSTHVFHDVPNLVLTPHIAGAFEGFWPAMITLFTENLRRFMQGQPLLNTANKQLGY